MFELKLQILSNEKIAKNTYRAWFECDNDEFFEKLKPGQFMQIKIPNSPHLILRRPIAVEDFDKIGKRFSICYFIVGEGTKILAKQSKGQIVEATGAIGNGFDTSNYQNIWLLSGGLGAAPLFSVVRSDPKKNYKSFLGFSNKEFIYDLTKFKEMSDLTVCTDDGSFGYSGFSLDAMVEDLQNSKTKPDAIFICGNHTMTKSVKEKMESYPDIPCFVSMESRMGCGIGTCLVCNCKTQNKNGESGYKRVCVDGPVFELGEVVFDE